MYWTLELASYLEDAPWPATKDELIDYGIRSGAPVEVIENSSLEYTILRPVWLTDKSIEVIELTQKGEVFKGTETSRASLGRFITDIVENPQLRIRENLGISQPDTEGDRPAAYR